MNVDLELYRREIRVTREPLVRLSVIDISPDHPQRTFVFIHGFGGQATQWIFQLRKFSTENRVIAFDLRGHGRSDKPHTGYDLAQLLDDLHVLLEKSDVRGEIVLVGHSFGGALAAEFAAKYPERVVGLILMATPGEFRLNFLYRLGLALPHGFLRIAGLFTRQWLSAPPHVLKELYQDTLSGWIGWTIFSKLALPVLVIRGHRDLVFEQPLFEKVAKSITTAQDADIGVSGHMVMLERREAVDRAIERFLAGESQRTWRDDKPVRKGTGRDSLRKRRRWLNHYEAGVPYTIGIPHVALPQLLRSAVRRFPKRVALVFARKKIRYWQFNREVNRFANALLQLGIGKGARVVLLLPNIPQMAIAFWGALKAGAVAVFLPPITEPEEIMRQIRDSEASVLVTLPDRTGLVRKICQETGLPFVILTNVGDYLPSLSRFVFRWRTRGLSVPGAIQWRRWLAGADSHSPGVGIAPTDLAVIQYTGGTIAEAKGVMLSHRNLVANALQTRQWMPEAREGAERFLSVLSISHSYGLTTGLTVPVSLGATIILKAQFQVNDILKTIKRTRPTIFPGVPSMYLAITSVSKVRRYDIGSIKFCISGSTPLPVEVQEAFEKVTKGRLVEGYGLTEASPVTHANPLNGRRVVGSIGIPLPSTEAAVVDLVHGRKEVPAGQIGELAVRGPQVMLGYWKKPEATQKVITADGWLLTGDVAQMDENGYFRIIARKADMWYPEKYDHPAFPRDVEEVLYEIPQIQEAVVVAIAGQPVAFLIAQRERPTMDSVVAYCKRRLPPALVPRFVIFMDEFPRSFIGKVLRRELKKRYENQQPND